MSETKHDMARAEAEARIEELERKQYELMETIEDAQQELERVERELHRLEKKFPPLIEVTPFTCEGEAWFTDGYRAFRGVWPGEHKLAPHPANIDASAGALVVAARAVDAPVTLDEQADPPYGDFYLACLSNGAVARLDWMEGILALQPGIVIHSERPMGNIIYKSATGEVIALQMPINREATTIEGRRPYERRQS